MTDCCAECGHRTTYIDTKLVKDRHVCRSDGVERDIPALAYGADCKQYEYDNEFKDIQEADLSVTEIDVDTFQLEVL